MISEHTLSILEFPKILQKLASYTSFSASRELATQLRPSTDIDEVRARQQRTEECRLLLDEHSEVSIGGARDVRSYVQRARRGGVLEASQLMEIGATLVSMRRLHVLLRKQDPEQFPFLSLIAHSLPQFPAIEQSIERTIGDDGSVLDSASPTLARLRSEIRIAFARLQEKLQSMLTSSEYSGALQEPIITMRNGRYVVPVKAGQRRTIRGLVHDQSGSGATLYIEPLAVVEQNNRWRELQMAEQEEIHRILAALSEQIGAAGSEIVAGVEALALLDLFFAQAKYANALRATQPEIVAWDAEQPELERHSKSIDDKHVQSRAPLILNAARHPLLDQSKVVPTDMELGGDWRLLLITGPNTGGKTVALKTTGLLVLMAQAGLHIPVAAPSRIPVFSQVFADIGDEQSIEQSLSTFSSHMTNIIRILRAIDEPPVPEQNNSDPSNWYNVLGHEQGPALVLLDELGAGTDPVEGAALARVIIERLLDRGCLGVATTHYAELKAYAYSTEGVQNASVEFDIETLAPTYKLTIGIPGRSNALAIAQRLGLDDELIERARNSVSREDAQVEDLLAGIHKERAEAAAELARAEELRADAEKYRERLAHEMAEFEAQRQAREEAAQNELEQELREVRSQLRRLRDDFRSVSLTRQWLEEAEQRVEETKAKVTTRKERSEKRKQAEAQARTLAQMSNAQAAPSEPTAPRPFEVGDYVLVRSVGLSGEIVAIDEEEQAAEVQLGGFRVRAELKELRREARDPKEERKRAYTAPKAVNTPPPPDVSLNFDMRGWRAGEVQEKLDRYLNDAYLAGLPHVRLIHGKGTGALRQVVRDVLQSHPLVHSFGGGGQDGGDGVTIARLVDH